MEDLTFGEQVKIVLGRKGMTIKELAETIERETGKKMSRQNLTQRLGRDNFQEQDMRLIAGILGCPFQLSIMSGEITESAAGRYRKQEAKSKEQPVQEAANETQDVEEKEEAVSGVERDMTIGERYDIHEELDELEKNAKAGEPAEEIKEELQKAEDEYKEEDVPVEEKITEAEAEEIEQVQEEGAETEASSERTDATYDHMTTGVDYMEADEQGEVSSDSMDTYEQSGPESSSAEEYVQPKEEEAEPYEETDDTVYETQSEEAVQEEPEEVGDINPYTGREYESNSVRMHPKRIGYVQVYDRTSHKWTDMTEGAFLGYQERKKVLLGDAYEPPIYLD